MLCELNISNFALIEKQSVSFGPGLNVISGETGAGKSMLLQALELILGGRPRSSQVRTGTEGWEIQALFDLSRLPPQIAADLPEIARKEELLISRSMNVAGRGKVFINGKLGSVTLLEEILSKIVNICTQGHYIRLLDPSYHLDLIDGFTGTEHTLSRYRQAYKAWQEDTSRLEALEREAEVCETRRSELEITVSELEALQLHPGLRNELEEAVRRLGNAEVIEDIGRLITDGLNAEGGVFSGLQGVAAELGRLRKLDPGCKEAIELFEGAHAHLLEFERAISARISSIEISKEELDALRERLSEIARLERKYKTNDAGLIEILERSRKELLDLQNVDSLNVLRAEVRRKREVVQALGEAHSKQRREGAAVLARQVEDELAELNMRGVLMEVEMYREDPGPNGLDRAQFLISTNKGEPLKALKEVASGGELSRIMLVLKKVLREKSGVNVLVFDEVDAGVSGGVARAVGEKLKALSEQSQVLCITHLAQVASLADHHFLVEKHSGERTVVMVRKISGKEQVEEVARMLSGHQVTEATRKSAMELLADR